MRFGAIDIGTNSCRLLIAEMSAKNDLIPLYTELETTRIGEGINQSELLPEEAIIRTLHCLSHFRERMQEFQVENYRAIATSAVRDAANRAEFVARAGIESGLEVEVISGEEEARLSYEGVKRGLELGDGTAGGRPGGRQHRIHLPGREHPAVSAAGSGAGGGSQYVRRRYHRTHLQPGRTVSKTSWPSIPWSW